MKCWTVLAMMLGGSLLAGCTSTSTVHYDLNSSPSTPPKGGQAPVAYELSDVSVPEIFDVSSLVVRQPNDSMMVLSHDKWVAPLGQVVRSALTEALTQQLGMPPIQSILSSAQLQKARLNNVYVALQQFDMRPAKQASITVLWRIDFADKRNKDLTCYSVFSQPVTPGVLPLVVAQQKNVQALAAQIASALTNGKAPQAARCQTVKTS